MRSNIVNVILFLVIATGVWFGIAYAEKHWLPNPNAEKEKRAKLREEQAIKDAEEINRRFEENQPKKLAAVALAGGTVTTVEPSKPAPKPEVKPAEPAEPPKPPAPPSAPPKLLPMGDSNYNLQVMLNTRGGAVQQVILTKFDAADRLGREVKEKDENGNPTKKGVPLYLIPGKTTIRGRFLEEPFIAPVLTPGPVDPSAIAEPSYVLYHYATLEDNYPDPFLGETDWKLISEERPPGGEHKIVLEAELGAPFHVKFRKTYTLSPGDYHIGFQLQIERLPDGQKGKGILRYQICGPRGLPLEGEWFLSTFRTALIGWNDRKGTPGRQYEDASTVASKRGSDKVMKGENTFKYMVIATQYFASGLAIDDMAEGAAKNPWAWVRATTETPLNLQPNPNFLNFEDLTVRAASESLDLEPRSSVTHSYVIYNGPAKVRLLGLMEGNREVSPDLVERYKDKLDLKTLTDFHSPSWIGSFANSIFWSDIVIAFTNLMHWLLAGIHGIIQSWTMSIVVLTVMVRLLLLYPSRKQTQMNLKMMEIQKRLAPQIEELKKKYGEDVTGFNSAKMRLMMSNGMNPAAQLGGCLLLFFQMPVMMGLYFCLQESIFFRLDPFLWINNMAAPDMTLWWSEKIPYISTPEDLGNFYYLGPYLNILPLIAVALMLWQQHKMMPPPTDEQTAQQQKMMRFMMILMAVMFYKVAAGLALYFIVGTAWGIAERHFFAKQSEKKKAEEEGGGLGATPNPQGGSPNGWAPPEPEKPKGRLGRWREAVQKRMEELQKQAEEQSRRQIRNDSEPRKDRKRKKRK